MKDEYPITSYTTVFRIWRFKLTRIKKYRYIVKHGVRPKDYPEKVGSVRYELKWI
jgi:hypothetical protein